jgi:hypothetical protein
MVLLHLSSCLDRILLYRAITSRGRCLLSVIVSLRRIAAEAASGGGLLGGSSQGVLRGRQEGTVEAHFPLVLCFDINSLSLCVCPSSIVQAESPSQLLDSTLSLVDRLKAEMRKTLQADARKPNFDLFPPASDIPPSTIQQQKRKGPDGTTERTPEDIIQEVESPAKLPRRADVDEEYPLTPFIFLSYLLVSLPCFCVSDMVHLPLSSVRSFLSSLALQLPKEAGPLPPS